MRGWGGDAGGEIPATLWVGLIPNQAPDRIRTQYQPFGEYLQRALGQPVEHFVATDYTAVGEAMASDRLDVAYFGGLTYVQAEMWADISPIEAEIDRETNTKQYHSALIVRTDSPIRALADLKEPSRTFAFGDINSTSGSLYPRIMLDKAGITNFTDPQRFVYTGGHDATTLAVNGQVKLGSPYLVDAAGKWATSYAACCISRAKAECRVADRGVSVRQSSIRWRFSATAVRTWPRWGVRGQ